MSTRLLRARAHGRNWQPIFGLISFGFGWSILALIVIPHIRDRMAEVLRRGSDPSWRTGIPDVPAIWAFTVVAVILLALAAPSLVRFIHDLALNEGLPSTGTTQGFPARRSLLPLYLGIAGFMAIMGIALLAPGEPTMMDSKTHVARAWLWAQDLRHGEVPRWTDYWYGGMPGDLHYPPLSHILGAI